jgi:hypothetical protein
MITGIGLKGKYSINKGDFMKFEWEKIYDEGYNITYRSKVIGGWLINNVYRVGDNYRPSLVFMEDKNHRWSMEENCHIDIDIRDFHVDHEWFSARTTNCLKAECINTVRDLLSWCEHQLYRTPNLGKKSVTEINNLLALAGLEINSYPHTSQGEYKSKCRECIFRE